MNNGKPIIGFSLGDANGIGPEILMKAFSKPFLLERCIPVVFADPKIFIEYKKILGWDKFTFHQPRSKEDVHGKKLNVIPIPSENFSLQPGKPTEASGKLALASLLASIEALKEGSIDAVVTCPIHKANMPEEFTFGGQTEFYQIHFDASASLMLMVMESIRIAVATNHIPVSEVSDALTTDLIIQKLKLLRHSLHVDFGLVKPKIAVLGLNPHASEGGKIGREDLEVVYPAVEAFQQEPELVKGPFPADGFFGSGEFAKYDGILAMYHDQGLVPFKILAQGGGVNFTAGLPIIRTSPAHGTAFGLAGKGKAKPTSLMDATMLALQLLKQREDNLK